MRVTTHPHGHYRGVDFVECDAVFAAYVESADILNVHIGFVDDCDTPLPSSAYTVERGVELETLSLAITFVEPWNSVRLVAHDVSLGETITSYKFRVVTSVIFEDQHAHLVRQALAYIIRQNHAMCELVDPSRTPLALE